VNGRTVILADGTHLEADFIVLGVGVRPSLILAEQAGLAIDRVSKSTNTSKPAWPESSLRAIPPAGPIRTPVSEFALSIEWLLSAWDK